MPDFSQYTQKTQNLIQEARAHALQSLNQQLMPEHILYACLTKDKDDQCSSLMRAASGSVALVQKSLEENLDKLPKVDVGSANSTVYLSQELVTLFNNAEKIFKQNGDTFLTVERLLQAFFDLPSHSPALRALKAGHLSKDGVVQAIDKMRKGRTAQNASAEESYDALKKYTQDLTKLARQGKLDPVIGRDEEIRRTMQVLSRRTKNNPVLIGEPGVGKTAIAEGLAERIVQGDVPENLRDKKLLVLDMGSLVAGAKYRGEFEERLKAVLLEVKMDSGGIVLFVDEMHTLVGAGRTDGAMDASNLIKPALSRGEMHCIGATTLDEYKKYVEKDAALARRFQPVYIKEPSVEDTVSILRGLKERYEVHHGVSIADSALVSAAALSHRYISDRFLPDKAIDLIDEAASRLRMQVDSKPEPLDELDRKIVQLKIEREALKNEQDTASRTRCEKIESDISLLEKEAATMEEMWHTEKTKRLGEKTLKEQLERARHDFSSAQREGKLEKASELMYSHIPELEKELNAIQKKTFTLDTVNGEEFAADNKTSSLLADLAEGVVTAKHIAEVVSRWTGIPVDKISDSEYKRLVKMEHHLHKRVVGQDEAVQAVARAVRRARTGLQDPNRPIGSFLFLGPTGVGKTELAKTLAEFLFNDVRAILRIDMSEYMEKHSVSRMIGAPPGYVGYEEGGVLTEAVRRRPYQVILLDEIEKAHSDIFNILLQVLDDGRLTDSRGKVVDFKNVIIIMTSNLGSEHLTAATTAIDAKNGKMQDLEKEKYGALEQKNISELAKEQVLGVVRQTFRPEFINRLDDILIFSPLSRQHIDSIIDIQMSLLQKLLDPRHIRIVLTQAAHHFLSCKGFDPVFGVRPLKRVIQRHVQDLITDGIISGKIRDDMRITLGESKDGLSLMVTDKQYTDETSE